MLFPTFQLKLRFISRIQSKSGRHLLLARWYWSLWISSTAQGRSAASQPVADKRNRSWKRLRREFKNCYLENLKARLSRNSYKGHSSRSRASAESVISLFHAVGCQITRGKEAAVEADLSQEAGCLGLAVRVAPKAEPMSGLMTDRGSFSPINLIPQTLLPIRSRWFSAKTTSSGWWKIPLWKSFKSSFQKIYSQACLYSKLKWWIKQKKYCSWGLFRI
jgi:hypothetical protein